MRLFWYLLLQTGEYFGSSVAVDDFDGDRSDVTRINWYTSAVVSLIVTFTDAFDLLLILNRKCLAFNSSVTLIVSSVNWRPFPPIWVVDSGGPSRNHVLDGGTDPHGMGQLWGEGVAIAKYRDYRPWAAAMRPFCQIALIACFFIVVQYY